MTVLTFVKKPVTIEAMRFIYPPTKELLEWMGKAAGDYSIARSPKAIGEMEVKTLEDGEDGRVKHVASSGDWIIKGVEGEFYACKPQIFEKTYEPGIGDTEQEFWNVVSVEAALMDILSPEVVETLLFARIPKAAILKMAGEHCFLNPDELGVRRHYKRIRTLIKTLNETNVLKN